MMREEPLRAADPSSESLQNTVGLDQHPHQGRKVAMTPLTIGLKFEYMLHACDALVSAAIDLRVNILDLTDRVARLISTQLIAASSRLDIP